jgi:D-psicose/D-tagatose/L-ribulose 3-epimerase
VRVKYGINTYIWTAEFGPAHFHLLPQIKAHGFDGIEVALFRPHEFQAGAIRRAAEAEQLERTVASALVRGLSLISDDRDVRRRTSQHLRDSIRAVADAGAHLLIGPLYCPVGELPGRRRTADEWQRAIEGFQSIADTLVENDVELAIEPLNRFETYFLNTAADGVTLCDAVNHPAIGLLFDTFHANIEEKQVGDALRRTARHLKHLHTCENDRGIPGSGHVDWPSVFQAIRDIRYDGWLMIESFGFALGDLSSAAAIWRDIEKTPESIAWDGLTFLKAQTTGH